MLLINGFLAKVRIARLISPLPCRQDCILFICLPSVFINGLTGDLAAVDEDTSLGSLEENAIVAAAGDVHHDAVKVLENMEPEQFGTSVMGHTVGVPRTRRSCTTTC